MNGYHIFSAQMIYYQVWPITLMKHDYTKWNFTLTAPILEFSYFRHTMYMYAYILLTKRWHGNLSITVFFENVYLKLKGNGQSELVSINKSNLNVRVGDMQAIYRIAGNFRWVLIFAISRTVYRVAKIKTAIIYSNKNSMVCFFDIAKIKIAKIIPHTFTFISRKFSSAKFSRYTVYYLLFNCPSIHVQFDSQVEFA